MDIDFSPLANAINQLEKSIAYFYFVRLSRTAVEQTKIPFALSLSKGGRDFSLLNACNLTK